MYVSPSNRQPYVPPLGIAALTPLYDFWLNNIIGHNQNFHQKVIDLLKIGGSEKILDVGCGTGTTLIMMKNQFPKTKLTGVDPDEKALQIAKNKASKVNANISFLIAYAQKLPFPNNHFDKVVSCLAFHHLPTLEDKKKSLEEIRRVLKKGGVLLLFDHWPKWPSNPILRFIYRIVYLIGTTADNIDPKQDNRYLPHLLKETGFSFREIATNRNNALFADHHLLLANKET